MEHAPLERRPESASPQLSQGLSPQSFSETPLLSENDVDYSQIPPGFQKSYSLGELPTSPPERMPGQPNGAAPAAPTLLAQSIALPAAGAGAGAGAAGVGTAGAGAGAGVLGVIGAGAALIWGGPLAQPTGDATLSGDHAQRMRQQQVLKASQRGRQGNVGDSGIIGEAQELIAQAKAKGEELEMKDALAQLMKKARQSNNGKGDPGREAKIRATQKAEAVRGSRQTKDGKKKPPQGGGKKGNENGNGYKGNNNN
jgi:hypothetical protein